jgi:glycine cleavage system aminomethyltransferase T
MQNFKFGTGKNINLNSIDVWAQRLSYVGELGYELYVQNENGKEIYDLIVNIGVRFWAYTLWSSYYGYNENGKWFFALGTRYFS